jgi:hypothetical protein
MLKTLQDELKKLKKPKKKKRKRMSIPNQESKNMSFKDIEELMGIRRPTYKRQNGAVRQK